jgi:hypothetical protein
MPESLQSRNFNVRTEGLRSVVAPIHIGEAPAGQAMPDETVFIDDGDTPFMRLHIYYPAQEYHLRTEIDFWAGWIVVGFAGRVVLVSIHDGGQHTIALSDCQPPESLDYFCRMSCEADFLLVTSGRRVFRIGANGDVLWKSKEVGLDGVIAHWVCDGVIHGSGEWDPPGGWVDFKLSLETGLQLVG